MKVDDLNLEEDTIKFSDTLNKDIWNDEELKPQVYNKLKEIANAFIDYLDLNLTIVDIQFTGSMANYNFNSDSDIDLHIIADFEKFGITYDLISDYFNAKKSLFNQNHDITIYGYPVELYVEDSNKPAKSGGKYSILYDKWIVKPQQITQEVEDVVDSPKYLELTKQIENVLSSEYNSDEAENVLDKIYGLRVQGLQNGGEFSEGNLIFKRLRSNGYLQKIRNYINKNYDKSLSLTESMKKIIQEDALKDEELRKEAEKIADMILKIINDKKEYFQLNGNDEVELDITDRIKNISQMVNNSNNRYILRFFNSNENFESPSFGQLSNKTTKILSFPGIMHTVNQYVEFSNKIPKSIQNKALENVMKKIGEYNPNDKEQVEYIHNYFKEVGLKYISQKIHNDIIKFMKENSDILSRETIVHECTHLLDDLRRTPTYKGKEQIIHSEKDYGDYYNSPTELNAYYQETVSKFKDWLRTGFFNPKEFKNFDDYYNEFRHQYSGKIEYLSKENERKLRIRCYKEWKKSFDTNRYSDFDTKFMKD